jgi:succinate dehydrogenase/fumarate reductase flavoprotein subunit
VHDWDLRTNLEGLYVAGQQAFDSCGASQACATGRWAGKRAAEYAGSAAAGRISEEQVQQEKDRVYAPLSQDDGMEWKELEAGIAKTMQDYCGDVLTDELMKIGLLTLAEIEEAEATTVMARNPHELMRALEVKDILTCGQIVTQACLARKASNRWLSFDRIDYPQNDPPEWRKWLTLRSEGDGVRVGEMPLDHYGSVEDNYAAHNG